MNNVWVDGVEYRSMGYVTLRLRYRGEPDPLPHVYTHAKGFKVTAKERTWDFVQRMHRRICDYSQRHPEMVGCEHIGFDDGWDWVFWRQACGSRG